MDREDQDLILLLATSSRSLATAPGDQDNWIERAGPGGRGGELPPYVRKLARAIMKTGKKKSAAIAIAISRIKRWAKGGADVNADTRAKAVKALAAWNKLKAKNAASKVVKASASDGTEYLMLSEIGSFNTDMVRRAWDLQQTPHRSRDIEAASTSYISEMWTDHIIVEFYGSERRFEKVPYTVAGGTVTFGTPIPVVMEWVEAEDDLTAHEEALLADVFRVKLSALEEVQQLSSRLGR